MAAVCRCFAVMCIAGRANWTSRGRVPLVVQAFGWTKKECKIVVVGLDGSGKSTLINFLKPKKVRNSVESRPSRQRLRSMGHTRRFFSCCDLCAARII